MKTIIHVNQHNIRANGKRVVCEQLNIDMKGDFAS